MADRFVFLSVLESAGRPTSLASRPFRLRELASQSYLGKLFSPEILSIADVFARPFTLPQAPCSL